MSTALLLEWKDLVLDALRAHLRGVAGLSGVDIEIGWVGNRTLGRPLVTLEAGDGEYRDRAPEVVSVRATSPGAMSPVESGGGLVHGEGVDQVSGIARVDYGMQEFPVIVNVWVKDERRGKTLRSKILRALNDAFGYEPGLPRQIELVLGNECETPARVLCDGGQPMAMDSGDGVGRDEWRARWVWRARHGLEAEVATRINQGIMIQTEINGRPAEAVPVY